MALYNFIKLLQYFCKHDDVIMVDYIYPYCKWLDFENINAISKIIGKYNSKNVYLYLNELIDINLVCIISASIAHGNTLYESIPETFELYISLIMAIKYKNRELCDKLLNTINFVDNVRQHSKIMNYAIKMNDLVTCKKYLSFNFNFYIKLQTIEHKINIEILKLIFVHICEKRQLQLLLEMINLNDVQCAQWIHGNLSNENLLLLQYYETWDNFPLFHNIVSNKMCKWLKTLNLSIFPQIQQKLYIDSILYHNISLTQHLKCKLHDTNKIFVLLCEKGNINNAKWLLNTYGINRGKNGNKTIDINYKNNLPFTIAVKNNHLELAKWLLTIRNNKINCDDYFKQKNINLTFLSLTFLNEKTKTMPFLQILRDSVAHTYNRSVINWFVENKPELIDAKTMFKIICLDYLFGMTIMNKLCVPNHIDEYKHKILSNLTCEHQTITVAIVENINKHFGRQENENKIFHMACNNKLYNIIDWYEANHDNVYHCYDYDAIIPKFNTLCITKNADSCALCLEETKCILQCKHYSCKPCLDKWLRINNNCPVCKTLVN